MLSEVSEEAEAMISGPSNVGIDTECGRVICELDDILFVEKAGWAVPATSFFLRRKQLTSAERRKC
jgi:hypothetical protein